MHFARGFQDVFLSIGLVLLMVGIGIAAPMAFGTAAGLYAGAIVVFALAWYFARSRRLVLPSIALAVGFTLFAGVATGVVLGGEGWANLFPGMAERRQRRRAARRRPCGGCRRGGVFRHLPPALRARPGRRRADLRGERAR